MSRIYTELKNAGCDFSKLSPEVFDAIMSLKIEDDVSKTTKYIAAFGRALRSTVYESNKRAESDSAADASAKLMGAITTLSTCAFCARSARKMSEYVLRKEYMPAQRELTEMAFFIKGDEELEKAYRTAGEMIGYLSANK